jgi:DNA mismatch repair ATPase MutL
MNKNPMRMRKHLKTMKNELNRVENITNRYGTRNSKRSFYFRKQVELTEKLLKNCPDTESQTSKNLDDLIYRTIGQQMLDSPEDYGLI